MTPPGKDYIINKKEDMTTERIIIYDDCKNDEAMRSRIWKISTMVSSVLIVIIAIFLLTKLFTTNPLEGSWVNEDGSLELKVQSGGELTAVLPEFAEGGQVEVPMSYTIDKGEKTISILDNEEEMQKIADGSDGLYTAEMLENAVSSVTTSFDYSIDQDELTLTEREYGEQIVFTKNRKRILYPARKLRGFER